MNLKRQFTRVVSLLLVSAVSFQQIASASPVSSPSFTGNLQFSAYAIKTVAEAVTTPSPSTGEGGDGGAQAGEATSPLRLTGLRLSWDELVRLVTSTPDHQSPVMVSIEDRHFIVITSIEGCTSFTGDGCAGALVHFMENGFTRTISASEFKSKWFGIALVDQSALSHSPILPLAHSKVLSTKELLKVKGAGWWKKLWKKVKHFFQNIVKAVVKVIKKVVSVVTKALTTVLGKTVGKFVASIITSPFNFILNSADLISQGNWKGLFKYWGMTLAIAAIQFIPVVGQVLGAAMKFIGSGLQFLGAQLIQFAASHLSTSFLGTLIAKGGSLLIHSGAGLVGRGASLIASSGNPFKPGGFSLIKDQLKNSILNQINPITNYQSLMKSVTQGVTKSVSGFSRLITNIAEQVGIQLSAQKIDQKLESGKMNMFLSSILSTVTNASIQAMGQAFSGERSAYREQGMTAEANGVRAPPTGLSGFFSRITNSISNAFSSVTTFLKDSLGTIKSIFIGEDSLSPNAKITFNDQGEASYYDPLDDYLNAQYAIEPLTYDSLRSDLDDGAFQYLRFNPDTKEVLSSERIGNLSLWDSLKALDWQGIRSPAELAGRLDQGMNLMTDPVIDLLGGPLTGDFATQIFLARELAKGYTDILRFGSEFDTIGRSLKSAFQTGELAKLFSSTNSFDLIRSLAQSPNLLRAGGGIMIEGGRAASILPLFGLAQGIGQTLKRHESSPTSLKTVPLSTRAGLGWRDYPIRALRFQEAQP